MVRDVFILTRLGHEIHGEGQVGQWLNGTLVMWRLPLQLGWGEPPALSLPHCKVGSGEAAWQCRCGCLALL